MSVLWAADGCEDQARVVLDELPMPVAVQGSAGVFLANRAAAELMGVSSPVDLFGLDVNSLLTEGDAGPVPRHDYHGAHGDRAHSYHAQVRTPVGTRTLEVHRRTIDFGDEVVALLAATDVTAAAEAACKLARSEAALAAERRILEATLASVHAAILAIDVDRRVLHTNESFQVLINRPIQPGDHLDSVLTAYCLADETGDAVPPDMRPLPVALRGERVIDQPLHLIRADGARFDIVASAHPIIDDGVVVGAVLTVHDVSRLREAERELRHLATIDPLTGVANRRALLNALDRALRRDAPVSIFFVDLDGFKTINDTFGHQIGDATLAEVARRLQHSVRDGDVVARHGGDEFVVMVVSPNHDPKELRQRIDQALRVPMAIDGRSVHIGCSIGVATATANSTAVALLAAADRDMYGRKHRKLGGTASI